jgi:hypothetical protein
VFTYFRNMGKALVWDVLGIEVSWVNYRWDNGGTTGAATQWFVPLCFNSVNCGYVIGEVSVRKLVPISRIGGSLRDNIFSWVVRP